MTVTRKKLIEVALPLEAINVASAREKSIRHGHPSTLHLWWARRPLAAARAVIFSQMVDDPSSYVDVLRGDPKLVRKAEAKLKERIKLWQEAKSLADRAKGTSLNVPEPGPEPVLNDVLADLERQRLFKIIEELVQWENTTNEEVLQKARDEIWQSWRRTCAENADHPRAKELFNRHVLPAFHDPFAGGGALPLEAQRLGLESHATDLNPVPVLINKAMIEIPPKFTGKAPVNPDWQKNRDDQKAMTIWKGAQGLAEDVRYYGQWVREEAEKRIGHLYPKVEVTVEMVKERPDLKPYEGQQLTVIAWLWARTVKSPNPAFANVDVPLVASFMLSTKAGKEAYVDPVIDGGEYRFTVKLGNPEDRARANNGTKLARGANFECLMSGTPMNGEYIKAEGKAGRMGGRLMAIVAEGVRGRVYLAPTPEHEEAAKKATTDWRPEVTISGSTQYLGIKPYGMDRFDQLFTTRQLSALEKFSDLINEVRQVVHNDAINAGLPHDHKSLRDGGSAALAYAEAVAVYLAFAINKLADRGSTICGWDNTRDSLRNTFGRQAIPMVWDFAEANPFSGSAGSFANAVEQGATVLSIALPATCPATALQADAQNQTVSLNKVVSTDPPYYDNVPYADLSDYFYVWLRRSLRPVFPDLFATVGVPKVEELVAFAYRHETGRVGAEKFFLNGMTQAMMRLVDHSHPVFPVTIYYAFKQAESETEIGTSSTGWETFLDSVVRAGFTITGTWPTRTELANRIRGKDSNALASSIVLVCRKREHSALTATRREFVASLKEQLPIALRHLQGSNIAPVDLAQAAIGPGMAVYTRYSKVVDADGKSVPMRDALALINQVLDETLAEQEGDFDADTRWALTWFEQNAFDEGDFGVANTLAQAKNTSLGGLVEAGFVESGRGKVKILKPSELSSDWDPAIDARLTIWEIVHHLSRVLEAGGERAAASLLAKLGAKAETARELCYRLYTLCERKKRANEAMAYNALVQSWPEIVRIASTQTPPDQFKTEDFFA